MPYVLRVCISVFAYNWVCLALSVTRSWSRSCTQSRCSRGSVRSPGYDKHTHGTQPHTCMTLLNAELNSEFYSHVFASAALNTLLNSDQQWEPKRMDQRQRSTVAISRLCSILCRANVLWGLRAGLCVRICLCPGGLSNDKKQLIAYEPYDCEKIWIY